MESSSRFRLSTKADAPRVVGLEWLQPGSWAAVSVYFGAIAGLFVQEDHRVLGIVAAGRQVYSGHRRRQCFCRACGCLVALAVTALRR